jgi:glycosyltransferase involved in cell wall biosynthesis
MIGANSEISLVFRRMYSEVKTSFAPVKKLRVIQLGSYPVLNRGARSNLLNIHERLQARGHESFVIDLTGHRRVKQSGIYFPRSVYELARLLLDIPADVIQFHIGSGLTWRKLALAALINKLPAAKTVCTLHLGGHFYPKKGLRGRRWGMTGTVLRKFNNLIAINPEIASFFERLGVPASKVHLITPFPRLRTSQSMTLSDEIETFCRQHTPLITSAGDFEPGSDLPLQFDILRKVRERYPSAGLIAVGEGSLHFKYMYERALHQDCNHIHLAGRQSAGSISELIRRANVFLRTNETEDDSFSTREARKAATPIVATETGRVSATAHLAALGEVESGALQVLRSLQIARPQYEDASAALSDGVDDVIRLYKQLTAKPAEAAGIPANAYELPSVGWGL